MSSIELQGAKGVKYCILNKRSLKHGLHMLIPIAEHACDDASKGILKLENIAYKYFVWKINTFDNYNDKETKQYL